MQKTRARYDIRRCKKHNINLHHSVLIGDKHSDLLAGHRAGINNLYLIENNKYVTKEKELFSKQF